ncbi:MAG: ABC transporter ATP-binding protein, partial [Geminicoccaceae bacterium]
LEIRDLVLAAGRLSLDLSHLRFDQGRTCCVIGKSGSGKSLFAAALSGLPVPGLNVAGDILLDAQQTSGSLWKDHVFVLPQEPATALDPTMQVGKQLAEIFRWRRDPNCPWSTPDALCAQVGLNAEDVKKFPEQLSGGMQQRLMIAMALAARAAFVVADEPTKGLDDNNKSRVIDLFKMIQTSGRGLIIITHDLDVARALADDVVVFDHGSIVEHGSAEQMLANLRSEAARILLQSEPLNWPDQTVDIQDTQKPVLSVQNATFGFSRRAPLIIDATIEIYGGEIVGLHGPSGAGKSTFADLCLGLHTPIRGSVRWFGEILDPVVIRTQRTRFQKLFQSPVTSFPPNLILGDVFDKLTPLSGEGHLSRETLLSKLSLDDTLLNRRPDQVSGGELQRLAIVRILLAQPKFLVCDEPSSRLDMSIQRLAIDIIKDYVTQTSAAVLLISHDRDVLQKRANRIFAISSSGRLSRDQNEDISSDTVSCV